ncbi:MAG: P1 family peptidase [Actinomycetota bacterium]
MPQEHSEGSAIVVVATDAPMVSHQVRRLAVRAGLGLARCGSSARSGPDARTSRGSRAFDRSARRVARGRRARPWSSP